MVSWVVFLLLAAQTAHGAVASELSTEMTLPKSRTRFSSFFEIMTPAIQGKGIPKRNGTFDRYSDIYNVSWMDYELGQGWKLLYAQRMNMAFAGQEKFAVYLKNPRLGIRKTQVLSATSPLSAEFDLFVQPSIENRFHQAHLGLDQSVESGFRSDIRYLFPKMPYQIGLITDFTASFYSKNTLKAGPHFYGYFQVWSGLQLNAKWSLAHNMIIPFEKYSLKMPPSSEPYVQSGVRYQVSPLVAFTGLVNLRMGMPSLKTTWASFWVDVSLL